MWGGKSNSNINRTFSRNKQTTHTDRNQVINILLVYIYGCYVHVLVCNHMQYKTRYGVKIPFLTV